MLEEFPRPVSQQFVETHLDLKSWAPQFNIQLLVFRREKGDSLVLISSREHIPKGHVLEALILADFIIWREGRGGREGRRGEGRRPT